MVWVGWLVRELAMFIAHTYRVPKLDGGFGFGAETGRIARSIALGQGFSSPFQADTGPTAWLAPIYPWLLGHVFKIFGIYSSASAIVILSLNSLFSALTVLVVYRIARRTFGLRAALWSGWLASLFPYAWYWAIKWAWETSLATLMLAWVFLLSMRMAGVECDETEPAALRPERVEAVATGASRRPRWTLTPRKSLNDWLLFGLIWGFIALLNPSLLTWLPFCGLWLLIVQLRAWRRSAIFFHAVASGVVFIALLCPWTLRNYFVFHRFIPVRGNFGVELRLGNSENANGTWRFWMHPTNNVLELQKYEQMGEVAYVSMKQREAMDFIRSHPGMFAKLCVKRAIYFWYEAPRAGQEAVMESKHIGFLLSSLLAFAGLWVLWRQRSPATFLYASLLFAAPLLYYVTFPHPRYRAPIEPEILVLMVGLFLAAEPSRRSARQPELAVSDKRA